MHDFAVEQGIPFLVMDYAPRGTFRQQYPRGSCLSLDTVVAYVRQVAEALQYAHNRNVIHRDVKPENILLGTHREALLSDFGLALFAPSPELLSTQKMAGTLPYMAPEQLRGKPCFASDQYALGIIVYEWLCGVRPFEGPYWQLFNQQISVQPPPLREKDPSLPEAVESVVLKALEKKPEQRYVSVQLFAQALERASQVGAGIPRNDSEETGLLRAISPALPVTHSCQMESESLLEVTIKLYRSGTLGVGTTFLPIRVITIVWIQWHGHLMEHVSFQGVGIPPFRCGSQYNVAVAISLLCVSRAALQLKTLPLPLLPLPLL